MSSEIQKVPLGFVGRVVNFPWKYTWKYSRILRFGTLAFVISYPLFLKIHFMVNSPENVKQWAQIREHRKHDRFAPVTEN